MRVVASKVTQVATASSAQATSESALMCRRPREVARWLLAHGETVRGPVTIQRIGFGHSNITSTVRDLAGHQSRTVSIELAGRDQQWSFSGEARASVPLRHRTANGANTTRITEACMTWSNTDGKRLHGMAEFLDQMSDGVPVGLRV